MSMDANALADRISERSGMPRDEVDTFLDGFREEVVAALNGNEDVTVPGLGVWNRPSRNHGTPAFSFTTEVVATPAVPVRYAEDGAWDEARQIADYLKENRVFDSALGLETDAFPTLPPALHPGVVTRGQVREASSRAFGRIDPERVAAAVIEGLRGARA